MKAPRVTIRALMILVAIVALTSFGVAMHRRSAIFSGRADRHYLEWQVGRLNAWAATRGASKYHRRPTPEEEERRSICLRRAEAQKRLYEKYRRAARFPWLPVAPDASDQDP